MQAARIEMLQRMPIFGALRDDALEFLLAAARTVRRCKGEYFFREGDEAQAMYVIESGRVAVLRDWHARELRLNDLGPGDCFGEMALLDLHPRSASVRAEEDAVAIELSPGDLLRLYEHDGEQFALVQMNIGRELCRRLRATDDLLFRATMGEAPRSLPPST
jgi:CRP/FNR family cyclic AMP-dependent transcriptional regulator